MKQIKGITMDKELVGKVDTRAKKESRNFSNMISHMANTYLRKNKKDIG